jgi:hypothetical protein
MNEDPKQTPELDGAACGRLDALVSDPVRHPRHYTSHPSGVECITVTEHMGFCLGNAMKYIWRADLKNDAIQDLEKARWYIEREIAKRKAILGR